MTRSAQLTEIAVLAVAVLGTHGEAWLDAGGEHLEETGMRNQDVHQAISTDL